MPPNQQEDTQSQSQPQSQPQSQSPANSPNTVFTNPGSTVLLSDAIRLLFRPGGTCIICQRELMKSGCYAFYYIDKTTGREHCSIPYAIDAERPIVEFSPHCSYCYTPKGEYHHFRCILAICPKCSEEQKLCRCGWKEYRAEIVMAKTIQVIHMFERFDKEGNQLAMPRVEIIPKGGIRRGW